MRDRCKNFWRRLQLNRELLLILSATLVVFITAGVFLIWKNVSQSTATFPPTPTPSSPTSVLKRTAPKVSFDTYEIQGGLPKLPEDLKAYTLKTDYSVDEIKGLGQKLGVTEIKQEGNFVILYNLTDPEKRGLLIFNRETGEFSFQSWGNHNLNSKIEDQNSKSEIAKEFLADLGVIDETVSCNITYQRQTLEAVTFVECHRDWAKVGLPIFNFAGILNLPETINLSVLTLGKSGEYGPEDNSIINTSTNDNGKARPNDFNTITVAITNDNRVMSIESNLRQIESSREINPDAELMLPSQALSTFLSHEEELSLTLPAGSGYVDWDKVYPQNLAHSQKAIITDYVLTYLEKPSPEKQVSLVPMYTIRGVAELSSGYTVRFAQTVPALKTGLSFLYPLLNSNLASSDQASQVAGAATAWFSYQEKQCEVGPWYEQWQASNFGKEYPGNDDELGLTITSFYSDLKILDMRRKTIGEQNFSCQTCGCPTNYYLQILLDESDWDKAKALGFSLFGTPTLYPTASSSPTPIVTVTPPEVSPTPVGSTPLPAQCEPIHSGLTITLQIPGLGQLVVEAVAPHTFFFISASFPVSTMEEVKDAFFKAVEEQYIINVSGWLNSHPEYLQSNSVSTIDEAYSLFNTVNETTELSCETSEVAPFPNCPSSYIFDGERMNAVAQAVAQRMLGIISQDQINTWALKPNLFPPSTLSHFAWVFYDLGKNRGSDNKESSSHWACYISGGSPSLYLYPQQPTQISVKLNSPVVYSDPISQDNSWRITVYPDGSVSQGSVQRSRLYYEYDQGKVFFIEPKEGFVIKQNSWESFVRDKLAVQLRLTRRETSDLISDVRNALYATPDSAYLKISLVERDELDEKLSISITPQPDVFYRIHLLLTLLDKPVAMPTPTIEPVERRGFTAVELGVRVLSD